MKTKIKNLCNRWFITAFSGMAQGLFCTLIAGTILAQSGGRIGDNYVGNTLKYIANIAKSMMGAGIGVGIAFALTKNKLLIFSSAVAGFVGAFADKLIVGGTGLTTLSLGAPGNPVGAYVVTLLVIELVSLYAGKTKLDIILVPLGTMFIALGGVFLAYPFIWLITKLGDLIAVATNASPFFMGIFIAVIMGVLLTMPTSSAAIWIAVSSNVSLGNQSAMLIAGGAATVGCACHMVGFEVGGQAVLGRQIIVPTPWLTERHGYDPT